MTHPFRPLAGQEFEFVNRRSNWDTDWVYFFDASGALSWVPAAWTNVVAAHPAAVLAGGRAEFLAGDVLALSTMVRERLGG